MSTATVVQIIDWAEQAKQEAVGWVKATSSNPSPQALSAFEAGHAVGWRDCVRTLKLQGLLPGVTDPPANPSPR